MPGYSEGPTLADNESPWPLGWEPRVDETCAHEWERYLLARGPYVVRCRLCHVPRCGHSVDEDPCMERRHHDSVHIYLSGMFEPIGGLPDQFMGREPF